MLDPPPRARATLRQVVTLPPAWSMRLLALAVLSGLAAAFVATFGLAPAIMVALFWTVTWLNIARRRAGPSPPLIVERDATLGADGLVLEAQFIPRSEIVRVDVNDDACAVMTGAGERIELRGTPLELERARHVAREIDGPRDTHGEALLVRVDVALLPDGGAYREAALDDARCLAIAEDPRADRRARIAASEHIRDRLADDERIRIAAAAEETAEENVRGALLAAARPRRE